MRKNVYLRAGTFFLVTLVPAIIDHVADTDSLSEVFDGVLTAVVMTIPFLIGALIRQPASSSAERSLRQEAVAGLVSGVLMWSLLWMIWGVVPVTLRAGAESWAFYSHLAVALVFGLFSGVDLKKQIKDPLD